MFLLQPSTRFRPVPSGRIRARALGLLFAALLTAVGVFHARETAAGVSLYDQLATPARPFYLKLRTHRGPLPMGGVRGSFRIDGQLIGNVLTGGDGYGYLKYVARAPGTFTLGVQTAAGDAEARLRIVAPATPVVLFEAEALLWHLLVRDRRAAAAEALRQVAANYELAYLCGPMGRPAALQMISERGLPERVILAGKSRDRFELLTKRGIFIYAVVGTAPFVTAARGLSQRSFSLDRKDHGRHLAQWEDLLDQLDQKDEAP